MQSVANEPPNMVSNRIELHPILGFICVRA
jgi:hypothetical protein